MPLPDSPPYQQQGTYRGKGKSCLIAGADGDEDMAGGGPVPPPGPPNPTNEERLEQAHVLYDHERQRADCLEQEIEALRLGQQPGCDPLQRRGPPTHRFSIPQPDNYEGPPPTGPSGIYDHEHPPPVNGIKPILMEKPQYFKGAHNDIKRFLGDCKTYFEVFRLHYMQHPALMIVFALSLLRGAAQDWWVHLCKEYDYTPKGTGDYDNDNADAPFNSGPQYRFPDWAEFAHLVREQFRDPAIELVHEKKMGELKMTGAAYLFF